ncbi:MAG: AMP-binding protein [Acidimicrobiales bacterium]
MEPHLATIWESVADVVGDSTAIVAGDVRRSWADFDDRSARLAGAFEAAGVGAGSKVAAFLYNSPEYLETYLATLKIRAVPVNVNYRYLDDELLYLLDNADALVLVFHASLGDRVERVRERATKLRLLIEVPDEPGAAGRVDGAIAYETAVGDHEPARRIARRPSDITMTYTGGTTGMPKGVMTPMGPGVDTILASTPALVGLAPVTDPAELAGIAARLAAENRSMAALPACPLMHATGLAIGTLPALTFGGTAVLMESRGLDPAEVWSAVERERVMALTIVGDAFSRPLLRELDEGPERDLSSLAVICSSGAMFSADIKTGLLAHLTQAMILDFIAATEGAMGISISTHANPAPTGRFQPNPGVKVFDAQDLEVAPGSGKSGVVAVPGSTSGYYKDEAKTARTFRQIDGVRYSIPGDWATVDADGSIVLLGRGSHCINTGGEKVYPEEVEEAIKRHPAVEDCLVFGLPDERFGQRVVGVASFAPRAATTAPTAEAVLADLTTRLSAYKVPRHLTVVAAVPRAPNGKADYPSARALFDGPAVP